MRHDDIANRPAVNQFLALAVSFAVVALQADDDAEILGFGLLAVGGDGSAAGYVYGQRLLREDVLLGVDGGFEVFGTESRRSDEQHCVHVRIDDRLVCINTDVCPLRVNLKFGARLVGLILKVVRHCDDLSPLGGFQKARVAGALSAAADPPDLNHRVGLRAAHRLRLDDCEGRGGGQRGRAFDETST
jgi:hypothetical protein